MSVLEQGIGQEKLLVYHSDDTTIAEEVVLTIQGYLVNAKLPPITQERE